MLEWSEIEQRGESTALTGGKYNIKVILGREIHLQAFTIKPSKQNDGKCLTLQYEIYEQLTNDDGSSLLWKDSDGVEWLQNDPKLDVVWRKADDGVTMTSSTDGMTRVMGWVQHVTFSGSNTLMSQLTGKELTEAVRCKIIEQSIDNGRRSFYKFVPVESK